MQGSLDPPFFTALPSSSKESNIAERERQTLYQILAASSDPILITSPDVKIVYVNQAWEKLTGYSFEEVVGHNPRLLQSGKTPKAVYRRMWQALKNQQPFTNYEVIDKKKDGTEFNIRSEIYPVIRNDKVIHYVQIMYDITREKNYSKP